MPPNPQEPIVTPVARVPARTRRQAMDWSLVLASQGMEPVIEQTEDGRWVLIVGAQDYDSAVAAIRQYRRENLRWPWRKPIPKTHTVFDWGSIAWAGLICVYFWLSNTRTGLHDAGIMDGTAIARGEWWRLFTATLLHADLGHLATNGVFGLVLLGLAMGRYGTGVGLLAAFIAGAAGNITSWLVHGNTFHGLGASGVVMGALGLLAASTAGNFRRPPHALKFAIGGAAGGLLLFVLLGATPGTDVVAHLGGFMAGLVLGALLTLAGELPSGSVINLAAGLIFAVLVIWTWALALAAKH